MPGCCGTWDASQQGLCMGYHPFLESRPSIVSNLLVCEVGDHTCTVRIRRECSTCTAQTSGQGCQDTLHDVGRLQALVALRLALACDGHTLVHLFPVIFSLSLSFTKGNVAAPWTAAASRHESWATTSHAECRANRRSYWCTHGAALCH